MWLNFTGENYPMTKVVRLAVISLIALVGSAFAQTYTVTADNSGVYSTPFRAFSIALSDGALVNWLEVGVNTACANQPTQAVGFIYLTLPGQAESPCASLVVDPVDGAPSNNYGHFVGVDANGAHFTGVYKFSSITTTYKCSGGRGGGCHTVFTIHKDDPTAVPPVVATVTITYQ